MTDNSPIRIFISYAREDYPIARKLYDDLKARGFCPWMDKVDLLIGQNWKTMTTRAIKECDYFLALMSNHSLGKRGYVQREMKKALDILGEFPDDEIFFLPVRIDECRPENEILQDINWADLFPSYDEGFGDILRTLRAKSKPVEIDNFQYPPTIKDLRTMFLQYAAKGGGWVNTDRMLRDTETENTPLNLINQTFEMLKEQGYIEVHRQHRSSSDPEYDMLKITGKGLIRLNKHYLL